MQGNRFEALSRMMRESVRRRECAGIMAMGIHDGREVFYDAAGMADVEKGRPMTRDTIFRMFSSTKCVTGLAAAMCIDRGLVSMRSTVAEYIPAFADAYYIDESGNKAPCAPTVGDLLNMTAGFMYLWADNETSRALGREYDRLEADAEKGVYASNVEFVSRLARHPLAFKPGDRWQYSMCADVMGAVIEAATGRRFGQFLKEEIFDPLGMKDTGFFVPPEKRDRFCGNYSCWNGEITPANPVIDFCKLRKYEEPVLFESGGAGLVSTIDDWAQLMRLFQGRGVFNGRRFLSSGAFNLMLMPKLSPEQARTFNWWYSDLPGSNYSFFNYVKMPGAPTTFFASDGSYGWDGALGTNSYVDPVRKLSLIVLLQNNPPWTRSGITFTMRSPLAAAIDEEPRPAGKSRLVAPENFNRVHDTLQDLVDRRRLPGALALVLHGDDEVYYTEAGFADVEKGRPLSRDAIFRMFSSTKTVTSVAMMQCIERGLISLRAPLSEYIPEFRDCVVGRERVPAKTEPLVYHVMNMVSGIHYPHGTDDDPTTIEVRRLWAEMDAGVFTSTVDFVKRLAKCPLSFEPGDRWEYGYGADVAGALVEIVSGKRFGQFLKENIFDPLGMNDTGFTVSDEKRARLATAYQFTPDGFEPNAIAARHLGVTDGDPRTGFESGGAGLLSTIDDWAQFHRMLLGGGTYRGERIISPAAFEYMTSNQLTAHQARTYKHGPSGFGYGNFFNVVKPDTRRQNNFGPGAFSWGGWLRTQGFTDRARNVSGIFMIQCSGEENQLRQKIAAQMESAFEEE